MLNKIFNTNPLIGHYCQLHHVELDDSKFIYNLRRSRGKYLKKTSSLENQEEYLKKYHLRYQNKEEIYFKMFDVSIQKFVGVTRFTELNNPTKFGFESGVMHINANPQIYLDAYFMVLRLGFEVLKKKYSGLWTVDNSNHRMIKLHQKIGIAKTIEVNNKYNILEAHDYDFFDKFPNFERLNFGKLKNI